MDIALTSVLIASKAEETYKKIHQVIEAAMQVLSPDLKTIEVNALLLTILVVDQRRAQEKGHQV